MKNENSYRKSRKKSKKQYRMLGNTAVKENYLDARKGLKKIMRRTLR